MYHAPAVLVNVDTQRAILLQEQLVREITGLERQRDQIQSDQDTIDFSMEQTFKEMIHSRRELLGQLPQRQH